MTTFWNTAKNLSIVTTAFVFSAVAFASSALAGNQGASEELSLASAEHAPCTMTRLRDSVLLVNTCFVSADHQKELRSLKPVAADSETAVASSEQTAAAQQPRCVLRRDRGSVVLYNPCQTP